RPTGKSGILVSSFDELGKYYGQEAQLWERQAITKARVVAGDERFGADVMKVLRSCAYGREWNPGLVDEVLAMRKRLESTAAGMDVKRGAGGVVDIEFLAELLCLKHGREHPRLQTPNTLDALHELHAAGLLTEARYAQLLTAYEFMRMIENRMRIVHNLAQDRLPESAADLARLAKRLGYRDTASGTAGETLLQEYRYHSQMTRRVFLEVCEEERGR
ncbi:MAG: bifunctional [glutamate--ammonia ligase]-adenylyl-L-tyrosine phosphorylase/[glutamate--ammonia-ligase] adenylyltransferase, partial [Planctomycetes bacterium]|nr:bifunctional [glutamate--ammonia ligase]-adenylyl-L-tyrosine phosphorylase/[glutamate--ammonia-ligase] adenylyltransferase [Planctomycetota bacterium]